MVSNYFTGINTKHKYTQIIDSQIDQYMSNDICFLLKLTIFYTFWALSTAILGYNFQISRPNLARPARKSANLA